MPKNKNEEIKKELKTPNYSSFADDSSFIQNIEKYKEFLAFARFYP